MAPVEGSHKQDPAGLMSATNVAYGPHERNVLDFWQAKALDPTPVVIYFHGGGFLWGDKSSLRSTLQTECLRHGISVVSANYRLLPHAQFPDFMMDGARVIQFIRSKANEWHIDPLRIALAGGSAGANIALWIGLHDDLADSDSPDPLARLSTRVSAVLSFDGQTSNDPDFILKHIGGGAEVYPAFPGFYRVQSLADMATPAKRDLAWKASAYNYASSDDPPIYLTYQSKLLPTPHPFDTPIDSVIHSPRFGLLLKQKLDKLGVPCTFHHLDDPDDDTEQIAFLLTHLKS